MKFCQGLGQRQTKARSFFGTSHGVCDLTEWFKDPVEELAFDTQSRVRDPQFQGAVVFFMDNDGRLTADRGKLDRIG